MGQAKRDEVVETGASIANQNNHEELSLQVSEQEVSQGPYPLNHVHVGVSKLFQKVGTDLPTGGKIKHFLKNWEMITKDPSILELVRGFDIPLSSQPTQQRPPKQLAFSLEESQAIEKEIHKMLSEKVIAQVTQSPDQFVSNIFTRPKKDGKLRTIINLKSLNKLIPFSTFKMEGLSNVHHLLKKGDLMVKIASRMHIGPF